MTAIPAAIINIDYAADDSCQIQCWARGHHDAADFLRACEQERDILPSLKEGASKG